MIKEELKETEKLKENTDNPENNSPEESKPIEAIEATEAPEKIESQVPPEEISSIINLSNTKYNLELWPTHHDVTEQIIKNMTEGKIKVRVTAETISNRGEDDIFCEDALGERFKVGLQKKICAEEVEVEIEPGSSVKVYLNTFTKNEYVVEEFEGVMIFECMGLRLDVPVFVKTFEPKFDCPKMLKMSHTSYDAIPLLLKPKPRQEFKIPITNKSDIKANCEFKIVPGGMNSSMNTFFIVPFRYVIQPNETVRVILTVKYNIQSYTYEEFRRISEMRKLINVRIKDTKVNMGIPVVIHVSRPQNNGRTSSNEEAVRFIGRGNGNK